VTVYRCAAAAVVVVESLGAISDISLAGAICTGTHGTGKDFPPLYGYVSLQTLLSFLLYVHPRSECILCHGMNAQQRNYHATMIVP